MTWLRHLVCSVFHWEHWAYVPRLNENESYWKCYKCGRTWDAEGD